jgi:hypothetical protein
MGESSSKNITFSVGYNTIKFRLKLNIKIPRIVHLIKHFDIARYVFIFKIIFDVLFDVLCHYLYALGIVHTFFCVETILEHVLQGSSSECCIVLHFSIETVFWRRKLRADRYAVEEIWILVYHHC